MNYSIGSMGSIFQFQENYINFSCINNSTFQNNYGETSLFDISDSELMIVNSRFDNNTNNIFSCSNTRLSLIESVFRNLICLNGYNGCLIRSSQAAIIIISKSFFYNISNLKGEGNIYLENSNLEISLSQMERILTSKQNGDCALIINSVINLTNSYFREYFSNCIWAKYSPIYIKSCSFSDSIGNENKAIDLIYGAIYCLSCTNITIYQSIFVNNTSADFGSALYFTIENIESVDFLSNKNEIKEVIFKKQCL